MAGLQLTLYGRIWVTPEDQTILNQILFRVPKEVKEDFSSRSACVGKLVDLPEPIHINIKTKLGNLQRGPYEEFVPLVITEIT